MRRRDGADSAFQHRAAVQLDAGCIGNRGDALRGEEAAVLLDLDGEYVRAVLACDGKGALGALQHFVGHQGDGKAPHQTRQGGRTGHRLLDQFAPGIRQRGNGPGGLRLAPGHVDVHPYLGPVAQRAFDIGHVLDVGARIPRADLQLEDAVAPRGQHLFGFGNVARGVARGQRPRNRQPVAAAAAQQFADGHAQALALRVQQGRFQRALGEVVQFDELAQMRHQGLDAGCVLADHGGREVGVDGQLHRLGAFRSIRHAGDGGALADAHDAIAAKHPDQHQRLAVHGGDGQLVRPYGRKINEGRFDAFDSCCGHVGHG